MRALYNFLGAKGQLGAILLGLGCTIIAIGSIVAGINSQYSMSDDLNSIMKNNQDATFDFFNPAIMVVIALIVIAIAAAVIFGLVNLISDPKASLKFFVGFAALAVLFFILYSMSGGEATGRLAMVIEKFNVSDGVSKFIGGGVRMAVISMVIAAVAAIVMEILNLFK